VVLEEVVGHRQREHREEDAHEKELDAGGAREHRRVHALKSRDRAGLHSATAGG
jgi:hypothetical protein